MSRTGVARTCLIVGILATLGMLMGAVSADALTNRQNRYTAQATLAMLPARDLPLEQVSNFWEVLNRGQATGSAAIVLQDNRWLASAAAAAGVSRSDLVLSAGAIPETTLVTVTMTAQSAEAAEAALATVLADAVGPAAEVSGPFRLETVVPPDGSATAMSPTPIQVFGTLGIAGALIGAAAGYRASRFMRERSARKSDVAAGGEETALSRHAAPDADDPTGKDEMSLVEMTL